MQYRLLFFCFTHLHLAGAGRLCSCLLYPVWETGVGNSTHTGYIPPRHSHGGRIAAFGVTKPTDPARRTDLDTWPPGTDTDHWSIGLSQCSALLAVIPSGCCTVYRMTIIMPCSAEVIIRARGVTQKWPRTPQPNVASTRVRLGREFHQPVFRKG